MFSCFHSRLAITCLELGSLGVGGKETASLSMHAGPKSALSRSCKTRCAYPWKRCVIQSRKRLKLYNHNYWTVYGLSNLIKSGRWKGCSRLHFKFVFLETNQKAFDAWHRRLGSDDIFLMDRQIPNISNVEGNQAYYFRTVRYQYSFHVPGRASSHQR